MCVCVSYLHQVVLHHVTDDAILVKVAATPFCAKRLLEGDLCECEIVYSLFMKQLSSPKKKPARNPY
jgi:hypothetical protein